MAIADDFSVAINGDIRYIGAGSTYYRNLELHRFLQDLADNEQASGNDLVDITSSNPSSRSTDNIIELLSPYNIDDDTAKQLYDGSITQNGGDTVYSGLVVVGSVETGTELQIIQDNIVVSSWWGTGINQDAGANILLRTMIKTRENGVDIDGKRIRVQAREFGDRYSEFSATLGLGNSTAAIFTSEDLNNATAQATVAAWDCSNTEGYQQIDLNNGNGNRDYYSQWDLGSRSLINDLYEFTKNIQRRSSLETIHGINGQLFRGITHQFNYDNELNGPLQEDEVIGWGCTFTFGSEVGGPFVVGERLDFGTSNAIGRLILLQDDGTTGKMVIQVESGTPQNGETITGFSSSATCSVTSVPANVSSTAGTGIVLALDDNGTTGTIWFQLLTGAAPTDGLPIRGDTSDATCDVNGSVTSRTVSPEFIGVSTGSAIIGAFGIGINPNDLSASDKLFDLTNTQQTPPNNQTFTVSGIISGEDRVIVAQNDGADEIDYDQFSLNTTLSGATETSVVITTSIPTDTPSTGSIRIQLNSGIYRYIEYTSWTGSTFTIASADFSTDNATSGNNVFISYVDELASSSSATYTAVYASDRSLVAKVRDGGVTPIKAFKTAATFSSSGGSVTAIRTSDL